jgi:hypothetical protein
MGFVATAIVGSAAIGAGASIYAGSQQAKGAKKAADRNATAQGDMYGRAIETQQAGKSETLAYLDPVRRLGLNAGYSLQQALYSPQQKAQQQVMQRQELQAEIDRLQASRTTLDATTVSPGKRYQTRKQTAFYQNDQAIQTKIREAEAQLKSFDQQSTSQAMFDAQQDASGANSIQASPWYEFQARLFGRDQDRYFAARGLTGSGHESEQRTRGMIELGAQETERQFGRLKGLFDVGANATVAGANAITGAATGIAGNQVAAGQAQGQAQAQGILGEYGSRANTAAGVANSVTGAVGAGLNYAQFQNLINANKTGSPLGGAQRRDPVYDSGDSGSYPGSSYGYLDKTYGPPNPYG